MGSGSEPAEKENEHAGAAIARLTSATMAQRFLRVTFMAAMVAAARVPSDVRVRNVRGRCYLAVYGEGA